MRKSIKRETQNETPLLLVNTAQSIFKELFTVSSKDFHDSGGMILVMAAATTAAPWDWSNTESEDSGVSCLVTKIRRPERGDFFECWTVAELIIIYEPK